MRYCLGVWWYCLIFDCDTTFNVTCAKNCSLMKRISSNSHFLSPPIIFSNKLPYNTCSYLWIISVPDSSLSTWGSFSLSQCPLPRNFNMMLLPCGQCLVFGYSNWWVVVLESAVFKLSEQSCHPGIVAAAALLQYHLMTSLFHRESPKSNIRWEHSKCK